MAVENTLNHGLKTSVLDSANKVEQDQNWAALDPNRISTGTFANRPAVGTANRFYYATDTQVMYWDDGTTWDTTGLDKLPLAGGVMTGNLTSTVQPKFSAFLSAVASNVTGDGTIYVIIPNTEIFDVGSNYDNTTGIFTAPVAGQYTFVCHTYFFGLEIATTNALFELVTSNRTYRLGLTDLTFAAGNVLSYSATVLADMDASDTAFLQLTVSGGTKVVDLGGDGSQAHTFFQGVLVV